MKIANVILWGSFLCLDAISLVACSDSSTNNPSESNASSDSSSLVTAVEAMEDLPACDATYEKTNVYVKSERVMYQCTSGLWVENKETNVKVDTVYEVTGECSVASKKSRLLLKRARAIYTCVNGQWVYTEDFEDSGSSDVEQSVSSSESNFSSSTELSSSSSVTSSSSTKNSSSSHEDSSNSTENPSSSSITIVETIVTEINGKTCNNILEGSYLEKQSKVYKCSNGMWIESVWPWQAQEPAGSEIFDGILTDGRDGNNYRIKDYGDAGIWMVQNLNYKSAYNSGEFALYKSLTNVDKNGRAYDGEVIRNTSEEGFYKQYLCPQNWHLPTEDEWTNLKLSLGLMSLVDDELFLGSFAYNAGTVTLKQYDITFGSTGMAAIRCVKNDMPDYEKNAFYKRNGIDYYSDGKNWYVATEEDSVRVFLEPCNYSNKQTLGLLNGVNYFCDGKNWRVASEEDVEDAAFASQCTSSKIDSYTTVTRYEEGPSERYLCTANGWRIYSDVDVNLAVCNTKNLHRLVTYQDVQYYCGENGWRKVGDSERISAAQKRDCNENHKYESLEYEGLTYYCNGSNWYSSSNGVSDAYGECDAAKELNFESFKEHVYVCRKGFNYSSSGSDTYSNYGWISADVQDTLAYLFGLCENAVNKGRFISYQGTDYVCNDELSSNKFSGSHTYVMIWSKATTMDSVSTMGAKCNSGVDGSKITFNGTEYLCTGKKVGYTDSYAWASQLLITPVNWYSEKIASRDCKSSSSITLNGYPYVCSSGLWYMNLNSVSTSTFVDTRDNYEYNIATFAGKTFMLENLHYETPDGKSYCYVYDESYMATCENEGGFTVPCMQTRTVNACDNDGRLYEWNAAMNACPTGWHLPDRKELEFMGEFIASTTKYSKPAYSKLRIMTGYYRDPDSDKDEFSSHDYVSFLWSSELFGAKGTSAYSLYMHEQHDAYANEEERMIYFNNNMIRGFSVRCFKD